MLSRWGGERSCSEPQVWTQEGMPISPTAVPQALPVPHLWIIPRL